MNAQSIFEGMDVFGSCGNHIGTVESIEGDSIRLAADHWSHWHRHDILLAWVRFVDNAVHLNKTYGEVQLEWESIAEVVAH